MQNQEKSGTKSAWSSLIGFRLNDKLKKAINLDNKDLQVTI